MQAFLLCWGTWLGRETEKRVLRERAVLLMMRKMKNKV